jgi:hypothetical protein
VTPSSAGSGSVRITVAGHAGPQGHPRQLTFRAQGPPVDMPGSRAPPVDMPGSRAPHQLTCRASKAPPPVDPRKLNPKPRVGGTGTLERRAERGDAGRVRSRDRFGPCWASRAPPSADMLDTSRAPLQLTRAKLNRKPRVGGTGTLERREECDPRREECGVRRAKCGVRWTRSGSVAAESWTSQSRTGRRSTDGASVSWSSGGRLPWVTRRDRAGSRVIGVTNDGAWRNGGNVSNPRIHEFKLLWVSRRRPPVDNSVEKSVGLWKTVWTDVPGSAGPVVFDRSDQAVLEFPGVPSADRQFDPVD